jgi:hypothetical protein
VTAAGMGCMSALEAEKYLSNSKWCHHKKILFFLQQLLTFP